MASEVPWASRLDSDLQCSLALFNGIRVLDMGPKASVWDSQEAGNAVRQKNESKASLMMAIK